MEFIGLSGQSHLFLLDYLAFISLNIHESLNSRKKGRSFLIPLYYFYQLHEDIDIISKTTIAKSSTMHIASNWNRTGNLWFPSASP